MCFKYKHLGVHVHDSNVRDVTLLVMQLHRLNKELSQMMGMKRMKQIIVHSEILKMIAIAAVIWNKAVMTEQSMTWRIVQRVVWNKKQQFQVL